MKNKLLFSEHAITDLKNIYAGVAKSSKQGRKSIKEITDYCQKVIADKPEIGKHCPELYLGVRSFPFERYTIFYREEDENIEIVRISHNLENRKEN